MCGETSCVVLQGKEPFGLEDLNAQLRVWVWEVANQRVHGTTHEEVSRRLEVERVALQPIEGRLPFPYSDEEVRKVARDAYVSWQGSRYSVPWQYAGREVWVRQRGEQVEVRHAADCIAVHIRAERQHEVITRAEHHSAIPLGATRRENKVLVHLRETAPVVEIRSLAAYESLALGGAR